MYPLAVVLSLLKMQEHLQLLNTEEKQLHIQVSPSEGILQSNEIFKKLRKAWRTTKLDETLRKNTQQMQLSKM